MKDIVSNCFLCGERSLHVAGTEESQVMQCIHCGYVSSTKYIGTKETNEEFQKLSEDMKKWAKEENNRIWIPSVITLPIGMLHPMDDGGKMKWSFAPMVKISEEEKEKYPNENGGFYEKRIDVENNKIYDEFIDGMLYISKQMKRGQDIDETQS